MDLRFTQDQRTFRREVREFLAAEVTDEVLTRTGGRTEAHVPDFYALLASKGWIGMQWPGAVGGQDRSPIDLAIFYEEMGFARAPLGRYTGSVVFVGGSLIAYGSEEQQRRYLPEVSAGRLLAAWALTEPEAGSDASALRVRAARDGDSYVVDGEKMFISGAHIADYLLTAVRTDPDSRRHAGLSVLLIPTDAAGVTIQAIETLAGHEVNSVHFDGVRVPVEQLVGTEGNGWNHINTTLGLERSVGAALLLGTACRLYRDVCEHVSGQRSVRLSDGALTCLVDAGTRLRAARLACYRVAALHEGGGTSLADAARVKVLTSEAAFDLVRAAMDILGQDTTLTTKGQSVESHVEHMFREMQFHITAGGSNDIQRTIIARHAVGLPRG